MLKYAKTNEKVKKNIKCNMKKTIIFVTLGVIFVIAIITNTFLIFPKKYMSEIDSVSKKYNLDKYLIASVINIESGYQVDSVSLLMQGV